MDQKLCPKCGAAIPDGNNYCTECGAKIEAQPAPQPKPMGVYQEFSPSEKSEYALITPWGWVGITLLLAIPFVGPILLIVWACGGCRKLQKRNYARGVLLNALISLVLTIIAVILLIGPLKSRIEDFAGNFPHESSEVTDSFNDFLGQFGYELDL